MAAPSGSNPRLKPKKPLEIWSVREKLCLASAVFKIGDQNWVSVSRAIKPFLDPSRPSEWFHQKNCRLQYCDLMEQLEQPKRKRGGDKSESDPPSLQIMRRMTIERSEQLKKEILEMQQLFKQFKSEVEFIKAGLWDDRIEDVWEQIKEEQRSAENHPNLEIKVEDNCEEYKTSAAEIHDTATPNCDIDDSTQDSVGDISVLSDEESPQTDGTSYAPKIVALTSFVSDIKMPPGSHLLSSLLKSDLKTATGLQRLKQEQEQSQHFHGNQLCTPSQAQKTVQKTPVIQEDSLTFAPSSAAPTLSRLLSTAKGQIQGSIRSNTASSDLSLNTSADVPVDHCTARAGVVEETTIEEKRKADVADVPSNILLQTSGIHRETLPSSDSIHHFQDVPKEEVGQEKDDIIVTEDTKQLVEQHLNNATRDVNVESIESLKEEPDKDDEEETNISVKISAGSLCSEAELTESSIKEDPLSPTSSISSKVSDGSRKGIKMRGRPRSVRSSFVNARKSCNLDDDRKDEGGSSHHSDVELSEEDIREGDEILIDQMVSVNASSIQSESFPNSPASLSICSDTEEEKSFKQWKKSIMLVWRAAATHKYANVFLHPVTDDIAPGYHSVVLRPMDLGTIKKNVEIGVIRSTVDFQHDMMLMFTNAIMYNSSDHNVFRMAQEMYDDVMQHIEQYVNTQMMMQTSDSKNLRQSRRTDTSDKEDEAKKRKLSVDQPDVGGKIKKRKSKADESALI